MRAAVLCFFVLAGCGGDYGETDAGTSSGGTSGAAGTSGAPAGTSGGSTSGEPDAGTNNDVLGATPGTILCGKQTCDIATQICCAKSATDITCQAKGSSCDGPASCDDAADCKSGQKCCGTATGFNSTKTSCVDKCEGITSAQTCRTNEECGAQNCVHQSCYGIASWLCGLNTFCTKL